MDKCNLRRKVLYFCVGCRQVHYDEDFKESDGDLKISDWNLFLNSVDEHKTRKLMENEN